LLQVGAVDLEGGRGTVRGGQNRIYAPYMTVYLVVSLPKIPYIHRIYRVLANPKYDYNHDMVVERGDCVWVW